MSGYRNSLGALTLVVLAVLIMGAGPADPPETLAQTVHRALRYRDGVVVVWNLEGKARWILGNTKLLQKRFLPGSLMKLITAEAASRRGVELKYRCEGHQDWGGHRENCWKARGHGDLDLPRALAQSCNLYFAQLGQKLGWEALRNTLQQYHFSTASIIHPDGAVLRKLAIGDEGSFTVTPLEMARFWEQYLGKIDQDDFRGIREGLLRAAREGTAQGGALGDVPILAKTGTAEAGGRPYKTHGWFLGAFPPEQPQWAVLIFLKNAHGYREAAQLGGELFKQIFSFGKKLPPTPPPPEGGACGFSLDRPIRIHHHQTIQTLPLEDYVVSVLASELPGDFPMEALKAQAVLIRTLAIRPTQDHRLQGYDFCDTTHCQLFRPPRPLPEKFLQAVKQTKGRILSYGGKPAVVLYHSQCGGHTSPNHRVFGGRPLPYLRGVEDSAFCGQGPQAQWESTLTVSQLEEALNFTPLEQIQIIDGEPQGRNFTLALEGRREEILPAQDFLLRVGKKLGWEKIKSAWFTVDTGNGMVNFKGRGLGHGVGMCQWGARGMALEGKNYREILHHYFPGTQVTAAPRGGSGVGVRGIR